MYFGGGNMSNKLEIKLKERISPLRWKHSLRVAQTAKKLASFWGIDPDKAWLAGICHDYARDLPDEELLRIATEYGLHILEEERANPVVLHAPVGALLVRQDLGVQDPEVLSAIVKHTVGGESMSLLDKIIFLADMVEPERDLPGVEKLRVLVYHDIDRTMLEALDSTIQYLRERKQVIHPFTLITRNCILNQSRVLLK